MVQVTSRRGDNVHGTGSNLKVRLCKVCYQSVRGHGSMVILRLNSEELIFLLLRFFGTEIGFLIQ